MKEFFHQPDIDPVLWHIGGPFAIRWYSLLYVGAFIVARYIFFRLAKEKRYKFTQEQMEQFILWGLISAVIGARIIYCFVYDPRALLANPLYLFQVYKGGLSFHGGLAGVGVAAFIFSKKHEIPFWNLVDAICLTAPTGLLMGRIGNFINGELFGRVTDVSWAVIFKNGGDVPRHPSQLYEAFLEGVVLFFLVWGVRKKLKVDGLLTIVFLMGYTLARFIVEFFRQPDAQLGFVFAGLSMGQILSIVQFMIAGILGWYLYHSNLQKNGS